MAQKVIKEEAAGGHKFQLVAVPGTKKQQVIIDELYPGNAPSAPEKADMSFTSYIQFMQNQVARGEEGASLEISKRRTREEDVTCRSWRPGQPILKRNIDNLATDMGVWGTHVEADEYVSWVFFPRPSLPQGMKLGPSEAEADVASQRGQQFLAIYQAQGFPGLMGLNIGSTSSPSESLLRSMLPILQKVNEKVWRKVTESEMDADEKWELAVEAIDARVPADMTFKIHKGGNFWGFYPVDESEETEED